MFGLFRKQKPKTVLDALIETTYGPNPPPRTADIRTAIALSHRLLLKETFDIRVVEKVARDLWAGPIPYSTHDLAVSIALNLLKTREPSSEMLVAAVITRNNVLGWAHNGTLIAPLAQSAVTFVEPYLAKCRSHAEEPTENELPDVRDADSFEDEELRSYIVNLVLNHEDFDMVRGWIASNPEANADRIATLCIKRIRESRDAKGLFERMGEVCDAWGKLEPLMNRANEPSSEMVSAAVQVVSQILVYQRVLDDLYRDPNFAWTP